MKSTDKLQFELEQSLVRFIEDFELCFDADWVYTKYNIQDPAGVIDDDRTFLNPLPPNQNESDNWGARGALLKSYRELKSLMMRAGLFTYYDK